MLITFFLIVFSAMAQTESYRSMDYRLSFECPLITSGQEMDRAKKGRRPQNKEFKVSTKACYERAMANLKSGNEDRAIKLFRQSCSLNDFLSCEALSKLYDARAETELAKQFLKKSCELGDEQSCLQLRNYESPSDIILWGAIFLIGTSVFLFSRQAFLDESEYKAGENLEENQKNDGKDQNGIILRYSRPFFKRYITPIVSGMKNKKAIKEKYRRPLANAGMSSALVPEDLYSFKIFLILGFPLLFFAIRYFLSETWPLWMIVPVSIGGYFYPDFWLKSMADKRKQDVLRGLPFAVDMLALSVEAGLDFVAAMNKVIDKGRKNALLDEFEIMIKDIRVGASRAEALRSLAWRVDMIQMSSFCATLIAADSVGASIGPILKELGKEVRQKKSAEAEKAGATAASKVLFPTIGLIIPAVFIILMAPIALEFLAGGG